MKRFIDLRGQQTGSQFAWWCTVKDEFERHSGEMAWSTWEQFDGDCEDTPQLPRYRVLTPAWAFEPDPDDDHEADTAEPWVNR